MFFSNHQRITLASVTYFGLGLLAMFAGYSLLYHTLGNWGGDGVVGYRPILFGNLITLGILAGLCLKSSETVSCVHGTAAHYTEIGAVIMAAGWIGAGIVVSLFGHSATELMTQQLALTAQGSLLVCGGLLLIYMATLQE